MVPVEDNAEAPKVNPELAAGAVTAAGGAGVGTTAGEILGAGVSDVPKLNEGGARVTTGKDAVDAAAEEEEDAKLFNIFKPVKTLELEGATVAVAVSFFVAVTVVGATTAALLTEELIDSDEVPNENATLVSAAELLLLSNDAADAVADEPVPNRLVVADETVGTTLAVNNDVADVVVVIEVADWSVASTSGTSVSSKRLLTRCTASSWLSLNVLEETPEFPYSS